jgi:WD40 repeat protein
MTGRIHAHEGETVVALEAHRDCDVASMRSYVETGDGCYWTVHALAWSPDGRCWASAGADDTVRIWDLQERRQIHRYAWNHRRGVVLDIVWSPDGVYLGLLGRAAHAAHAAHSGHDEHACHVVVLDARSGEEVFAAHDRTGAEMAWPATPPGVPVAPESIAVVARDQSREWSADRRFYAASGQEEGHEPSRAPGVQVPSDASVVLWSTDGARSGHHAAGGTVRVVEWESGQTALALPHGTARFAWSPMGNWIAGAHGKTVTVWEAERGTIQCEYRRHAGVFNHVTCLSWAPSGQHIATGDATGVIHLWRVWQRD